MVGIRTDIQILLPPCEGLGGAPLPWVALGFSTGTMAQQGVAFGSVACGSLSRAPPPLRSEKVGRGRQP